MYLIEVMELVRSAAKAPLKEDVLQRVLSDTTTEVRCVQITYRGRRDEKQEEKWHTLGKSPLRSHCMLSRAHDLPVYRGEMALIMCEKENKELKKGQDPNFSQQVLTRI